MHRNLVAPMLFFKTSVQLLHYLIINWKIIIFSLLYFSQLDALFCNQFGNIDFCETDAPVNGLQDRCNVDDYLASNALWNLVQDFNNENTCKQSGCRTACNNLLRVTNSIDFFINFCLLNAPSNGKFSFIC